MEYLWLIFAILSAVCAAAVAIFGKIGLQGIDPNTATAIRAIVMAIFLVTFVLITDRFSNLSSILANKKAVLFIILGGIAGAMSWLFYFMALKLGKVSQVAPVDRLSVVFAIILAFMFLGEHISVRAGIGAAMLTVGAILIALG
ncbi:MAG TPA: EamA family transporter [Alphaproteobacteria bacterium]|nr:EamA family transporter [Alphaproteobacteria bacterium]